MLFYQTHAQDNGAWYSAPLPSPPTIMPSSMPNSPVYYGWGFGGLYFLAVLPQLLQLPWGRWSMTSQMWNLLPAPGNNLASKIWILALLKGDTPAWDPSQGSRQTSPVRNLEQHFACQTFFGCACSPGSTGVGASASPTVSSHALPSQAAFHPGWVMPRYSFNKLYKDSPERFLVFFTIAQLPIYRLISHSHSVVSRGISHCRITGPNDWTLKQIEKNPKLKHVTIS